MPEAIPFKLCGHGRVVQHGVVALFCFGGWDVADGLQQSPVVEPVDPFERGVLDRFKRSPRSASVDHLGLVEPVDRLGERIVVGIADTADGRLDAGLGQALGIFDREILASAVAMVDEAATMGRSPLVDGLLQGNRLDETRIRHLDDLGFVWDPHDAAWEEKFSSPVVREKWPLGSVPVK